MALYLLKRSHKEKELLPTAKEARNGQGHGTFLSSYLYTRLRKSMMIACTLLKIRTNYIQNTNPSIYGLPNLLELIAYVGHILFSS
jgi:hypothetical protein